MQSVILPTYPCYTCQKKLGEPNEMQLIAPGVYFCPVCKNTKDRITAMRIVSISSLTTAVPLLKATLPTLQSLTLEAQIGLGAFLFMGYLLGGLRMVGR